MRPRFDPTEKMRGKLSRAVTLIHQFEDRCDRETAWMLRKIYHRLSRAAAARRSSSLGDGPQVAKHKAVGYAEGAHQVLCEFAYEVTAILGLDPTHREYPFESIGVAKLAHLAEAYDLWAAFEAAEALGNWCLSAGMNCR